MVLGVRPALCPCLSIEQTVSGHSSGTWAREGPGPGGPGWSPESACPSVVHPAGHWAFWDRAGRSPQGAEGRDRSRSPACSKAHSGVPGCPGFSQGGGQRCPSGPPPKMAPLSLNPSVLLRYLVGDPAEPPTQRLLTPKLASPPLGLPKPRSPPDGPHSSPCPTALQAIPSSPRHWPAPTSSAQPGPGQQHHCPDSGSHFLPLPPWSLFSTEGSLRAQVRSCRLLLRPFPRCPSLSGGVQVLSAHEVCETLGIHLAAKPPLL